MTIQTFLKQLNQSRIYRNCVISTGIILTTTYGSLPLLAQTQPSSLSIAPQVRTNSVSIDTNYTVGAGDRLLISLLQEENYTGEYTIAVDGTVSLPLVGNLQVKGLTLSNMTELITQRYAHYIKRPVVTVTLLEPRPLNISVVGEVQRPGSYEVNFEEDQQFPSVTRLLELAGGITVSADIRQIQIQRNQGGTKQVRTVNLWDYLQQGDESQNLILRDGDVVSVPTVDSPNLTDMAQMQYLDDVTFGIQPQEAVQVAVIGEVYRPGTYKVSPEDTETPRSATLTEAIQLAGGIKPLADIRQVEIRRQTRDGSQQVLSVNLWELLQAGDTSRDTILQKGDTIVIPAASRVTAAESRTLAEASFAPATIGINVVGEVNSPGLVEVAPNTPLNQAILAAGGFVAERANQSSVELIRLNPDGTVSKKEIQINLAAGIDEANNPILRNDDVVVVKRSAQAGVSDGLGMFLTPLQFVFPFLRFIDD